MEAFPIDLACFAGLLLANRTIVPELKNRYAFWTFQAVNLGAAGWFAFRGVEGLETYPVASWLVAGLLVFHGVQNAVVYSTRGPKL